MVDTRQIHQAPLLERITKLEAENKSLNAEVETLRQQVNDFEKFTNWNHGKIKELLAAREATESSPDDPCAPR